MTAPAAKTECGHGETCRLGPRGVSTVVGSARLIVKRRVIVQGFAVLAHPALQTADPGKKQRRDKARRRGSAWAAFARRPRARVSSCGRSRELEVWARR